MDGAKVFLTSGGGSDAIDTAAKLARAFWTATGRPEKRAVLSRSLAYHGMNAYGTSLGGIPLLVSSYEPLVGEVERVQWNDAGALAEAIDRIGPERVAAFFCEPVMGAGGVLPRPTAIWPKCSASAANVTCCSSPTRSSADSGGWASGSVRSAWASRRT